MLVSLAFKKTCMIGVVKYRDECVLLNTNNYLRTVHVLVLVLCAPTYTPLHTAYIVHPAYIQLTANHKKKQ